ncbi:MAG: arginine--tRNA ligase [Pseudomonadota bacterium]
MKAQLLSALEAAVQQLVIQLGSDERIEVPTVKLEVPKNPEHGDYSSNISMLLAKPLRKAPRDIAANLLELLGTPSFLESTDIAGPGFINFTLTQSAITHVLQTISDTGDNYGRVSALTGQRVLIEFVSANPTGPLHVGHGRGAAYGDAIASLLRAAGAEVDTEYYVNDAGRQMDILTLSVWIRYLQIHKHDVGLPANAYQGGYIIEIAESLRATHGDMFISAVIPKIDAEASEEHLERALDQSISAARNALGEQYSSVARFVCDAVLDGIKKDLSAFGVEFKQWFSENSLVASGALNSAVERLEQSEHIYEQDGAKWFRSTSFGDEKDRVVIRDNGLSTYFASDIAYHAEKASRTYSRLINIWGADHHGYIQRVRAAMTALGIEEEQLEIILVQFAALFRDGEKVAMSTRSGEFVTLIELIEEVGADAARFFYLSRRADQHLDFDLDLAKSKSNENPVYYVQYAHARICSVFDQMKQLGQTFEQPGSEQTAENLQDIREKSLLAIIAQFPELIASAATMREPHLVTNYLRELAAEFHGYYNGTKFLVDDPSVRASRLSLIAAVQQVIRNGLALLSISAPTKM